MNPDTIKTFSTWCRQVSAAASTSGITQLRASFGILISGLAAVAAICAAVLFLYFRCDAKVRSATPRYFLAMVVCLLTSSLAGIFGYSAYMQALSNYYLASGDYSSPDDFRHIGVNFYWFSMFAPVYPWFAVLNCSAKLIVLHLFFTTFLGTSNDLLPAASTATHRAFTAVLAIVALLFCGSIVAWSVSSSHAAAASSFFQIAALNATDKSAIRHATDRFNSLNEAQAVGNHFETTYLCLISVTYFIVGFLAARRLHRHMDLLENAPSSPAARGTVKGTMVQRRFIIAAALVSLKRSDSVVFSTSLVIFMSYIVNATYAIIYSIASAGTYTSSEQCLSLCDPACQSPAAILNHVLRLTPALTSAVLLLSLVLAPLVALFNVMRGRIWYMLMNRSLPMTLPCTSIERVL
jgi:hypothetical protein